MICETHEDVSIQGKVQFVRTYVCAKSQGEKFNLTTIKVSRITSHDAFKGITCAVFRLSQHH